VEDVVRAARAQVRGLGAVCGVARAALGRETRVRARRPPPIVRPPSRPPTQVEATGYSFADAPRFSGPPPVPAPSTFLGRAKAAWSVLFPPPPPAATAREAGKQRLRMILVADR